MRPSACSRTNASFTAADRLSSMVKAWRVGNNGIKHNAFQKHSDPQRSTGLGRGGCVLDTPHAADVMPPASSRLVRRRCCSKRYSCCYNWGRSHARWHTLELPSKRRCAGSPGDREGPQACRPQRQAGPQASRPQRQAGPQARTEVPSSAHHAVPVQSVHTGAAREERKCHSPRQAGPPASSEAASSAHLAVPVHAGSQAAQLVADAVSVLAHPLPHLLQEALAACSGSTHRRRFVSCGSRFRAHHFHTSSTSRKEALVRRRAVGRCALAQLSTCQLPRHQQPADASLAIAAIAHSSMPSIFHATLTQVMPRLALLPRNLLLNHCLQALRAGGERHDAWPARHCRGHGWS